MTNSKLPIALLFGAGLFGSSIASADVGGPHRWIEDRDGGRVGGLRAIFAVW